MAELKKCEIGKIRFRNYDLKKYFTKSYILKKMQDIIFKLLESWQKKGKREIER